MLRHKGKNRTFLHNLKLASILSFVAGLVNIAGLLYSGILTTNVTGHFAYFAEELVNGNYIRTVHFIGYILAFLSGAFLSGILMQVPFMKAQGNNYILPLLTEIFLICFAGFSSYTLSSELTAGMLLLAMGLQNALVTFISNSVVRTTHLTGLFTDLGIELSQLCFRRKQTDRNKLSRNIGLRISIIAFFFAGGVLGGFGFKVFGIKILIVALICLISALAYDTILFRLYRIKRKIKEKAWY